MTEEFILEYIPIRIKELGYSNYHIRPRDFMIKGNSMKTLTAYNELYFIVGEPQGLLIESDYGVYDSTGSFIEENACMHRGEINITNQDTDPKRIKMIQIIIVS